MWLSIPISACHFYKYLEYVQRITVEATLNHEWCREVPYPKSKDCIPTFHAHHAQDRYPDYIC